ncbi:hypothetical protein O0L34_g9120 [Tuta absoluta]|nr:hypothetical protein O0L34_g9120 [Tuta absoluta]
MVVFGIGQNMGGPMPPTHRVARVAMPPRPQPQLERRGVLPGGRAPGLHAHYTPPTPTHRVARVAMPPRPQPQLERRGVLPGGRAPGLHAHYTPPTPTHRVARVAMPPRPGPPRPLHAPHPHSPCRAGHDAPAPRASTPTTRPPPPLTVSRGSRCPRARSRSWSGAVYSPAGAPRASTPTTRPPPPTHRVARVAMPPRPQPQLERRGVLPGGRAPGLHAHYTPPTPHSPSRAGRDAPAPAAAAGAARCTPRRARPGPPRPLHAPPPHSPCRAGRDAPAPAAAAGAARCTPRRARPGPPRPLHAPHPPLTVSRGSRCPRARSRSWSGAVYSPAGAPRASTPTTRPPPPTHRVARVAMPPRPQPQLQRRGVLPGGRAPGLHAHYTPPTPHSPCRAGRDAPAPAAAAGAARCTPRRARPGPPRPLHAPHPPLTVSRGSRCPRARSRSWSGAVYSPAGAPRASTPTTRPHPPLTVSRGSRCPRARSRSWSGAVYSPAGAPRASTPTTRPPPPTHRVARVAMPPRPQPQLQRRGVLPGGRAPGLHAHYTPPTPHSPCRAGRDAPAPAAAAGAARCTPRRARPGPPRPLHAPHPPLTVSRGSRCPRARSRSWSGAVYSPAGAPRASTPTTRPPPPTHRVARVAMPPRPQPQLQRRGVLPGGRAPGLHAHYTPPTPHSPSRAGRDAPAPAAAAAAARCTPRRARPGPPRLLLCPRRLCSLLFCKQHNGNMK